MNLHEKTVRAYVDGDASATDRQKAEAHLKECGECRESLAFVRDLSQGIREVADKELAEKEPCPSSGTILDYAEGKLDAETALHVRAHMLFCDRCADSYYAVRRMRAPSWTDVVIEAVHSAKETLLRAVEITGVGEIVPLPATATREPGQEAPETQPTIEISQHVADAGEEADVLFTVEPHSNEPGAPVRIRVTMDPPKSGWRADLLDARENTIASIPLSERTQPLHSSLGPGAFVAQIVRDEDVLAECRLKIQASHEPASSHRDR